MRKQEAEARGPGTEVYCCEYSAEPFIMPSLPATLNQAQLRERIRKEE